MKYSEIRDQLKSGDVVAWTHRSWSNFHDIQIQLVRFFTQSEYSHIGTILAFGGRIFVLEAVGTGVRIFPLRMSGDFYLLQRDGWVEEMEVRAMSKIGAKYSKWEAIKAMFGKTSYNNAAWECAEYVCYVLDLTVAYKTPAEVVRHLTENEGLSIKAIISD